MNNHRNKTTAFSIFKKDFRKNLLFTKNLAMKITNQEPRNAKREYLNWPKISMTHNKKNWEINNREKSKKINYIKPSNIWHQNKQEYIYTQSKRTKRKQNKKFGRQWTTDKSFWSTWYLSKKWMKKRRNPWENK